MNPLEPTPSILCKLGSHVDEGMGAKGHAFDMDAIRSLMADPELKEWVDGMDKMALVPMRRG